MRWGKGGDYIKALPIIIGNSEEEHESTTHFVIIDRDGTVVSSTNTLSNFFGTGDYTEGLFLNNQLQNFGSNGPNRYEPGKRSGHLQHPPY